MSESKIVNSVELKARLSDKEKSRWRAVIESGIKAQQLVADVAAVGGTVAALYAGHRISFDTDHLSASLKDHFDEVLVQLTETPEWKTARIKRPVLILGSVNGQEVGFRQLRSSQPFEKAILRTPYGDLIAPTLGELIGMKAYLAYFRNATRDYLDFAALSECLGETETIRSLLRLDDKYGELQTTSVRLEVAKSLALPEPFDLQSTNLAEYKALSADWQDWQKTLEICRHYGALLAEKLMGEMIE